MNPVYLSTPARQTPPKALIAPILTSCYEEALRGAGVTIGGTLVQRASSMHVRKIPRVRVCGEPYAILDQGGGSFEKMVVSDQAEASRRSWKKRDALPML
jgi:hypothetical protein